MSKFEFSVLIPVYLKENPSYFDVALSSIVNQTYLPAEVVIVEDGPLTNELDTIIDDYCGRFPGLFNIIKLAQNQGMGAAMNIGLQNCKYEWVARMDSDDICLKDRFQKQVSFLQKHPELDALGSFTEEFRSQPGDFGKIRKLPTSHAAILEYAKRRSPINHMTIMYRRKKAIEAGGYWDKKIFEDYNLWYQMLKMGCKFNNLEEVLVDVRVGNNMVGRRKGLNYFKQEFGFFKQMKNEKFINTAQFLEAISVRFLFRIMPKVLLEKVYYLLLRDNKK
ncbi:glycosyltransferase [Chitinophaga sp. XS-30]|uniref:glycosyltransferase n=1 Tax=Chitinophaga sp. XS-30 TaxID=2604421 RepID=UPI0011DDE4CE|nr:glycosyltransferase [Chitinophaga sp. XS-30]QEH39762.1 glycosyltransferase [Chitinophaga sp. XS-30]